MYAYFFEQVFVFAALVFLGQSADGSEDHFGVVAEDAREVFMRSFLDEAFAELTV